MLQMIQHHYLNIMGNIIRNFKTNAFQEAPKVELSKKCYKMVLRCYNIEELSSVINKAYNNKHYKKSSSY